jgi:colanic acid/amylovoran biosynthesis glycosyltransferase
MSDRKILFLMPNYKAFSEVWLQRMIEMIQSNVCLIGAYGTTETLWREQIPVLDLTRLPFPIHLLNKFLPVVKNTDIFQVKKAVKSGLCDVVLIHYLEFALKFESVWRSSNKPLFVHCHGYDITWDLRMHNEPSNPRFDSDYVAAVRRLSEKAILVANSKFTYQKLVEVGVPEERIVTKYLGVAVPEFPLKRNKQNSKIEILYLGRLMDFKGPDLVIRAFELACEQGLDGHLTIAGDGELRVTCELLCKRSQYCDRITLLGKVDPVESERLRTKADIFTAHNCKGILSRQEEAFGVSIIEAMAAALPVISARSGALSETVIDEVTGFLINPGDIEAHAAAFIKLANDPELRFEMGSAGWKRVKENFSYEQERLELHRILGI